MMDKNYFDLSKIKQLIGKQQPLTENEAYLSKCPVDLSELRRFALSVEDNNPLWFEEEYAKNTKWKGIIAAPTFAHTCGGGRALHVHIDGTDDWPQGSLFAGSEFDFKLPIRVGDRITPISKLYSVEEKFGRFVGPMVFLTAETAFINQNNEVTCLWRSSIAKYSTSNAQKKASYSEEKLGEMFPPGHPDQRRGENRARGNKPLYYENVEVGDIIPPLTRTLTIPQIVATADVEVRQGIMLPYTMPGPGCYWHYALGESWKMRGLPAPMDEGPIRATQPSQLFTDWMGDDGWLNQLTMQVRHPIFAGDTTVWKGTVTKKYIKNGQCFVECSYLAENQRGQTTTTGNATIILPSKK